MLDVATYRLLSTESETPRPRVLHEGSYVSCLDELQETLLADLVTCNRGALLITARVDGDDRGIDVLTVRTTGNGF